MTISRARGPWLLLALACCTDSGPSPTGEARAPTDRPLTAAAGCGGRAAAKAAARPGALPASLNSDGSRKVLDAPTPSRPGQALVFTYADFGPQSMATRLIGSEHYSWSRPGCFELEDEFDVRVVVFVGDRAVVQRLYPTAVDHADHRLVPRAAALDYLDAEIAGLDGVDEELLVTLRARLEATRERITRGLGGG